MNHLSSISGTGDPERSDVRQTFLQPFLALCMKKAFTLTLQSESTANWEAADEATWTIPVKLLVSKVTTLGASPFSVLGGAGVFVSCHSGGPEWKIRTAFTLTLPRES